MRYILTAIFLVANCSAGTITPPLVGLDTSNVFYDLYTNCLSCPNGTESLLPPSSSDTWTFTVTNLSHGLFDDFHVKIVVNPGEGFNLPHLDMVTPCLITAGFGAPPAGIPCDMSENGREDDWGTPSKLTPLPPGGTATITLTVVNDATFDQYHLAIEGTRLPEPATFLPIAVALCFLGWLGHSRRDRALMSNGN